MSCNYAEGLSEYEDKGKLGLPEKFDAPDEVDIKVKALAEYVKESRHIVVHTGAGISTSAGIPDFRGPKGVWTLERKGLKPSVNVSWDEAVPTKTHMALAALADRDVVKFVVTQNIDGMHMRSGLDRSRLAELHGNMFVDQCNACKKQFARGTAAVTVGQKVSDVGCPAKRPNGRACRGKLADFVLDWEDELPDSDLDLSDAHSCLADLSIVLGSTLQIVPAGNLPTYAKKYHENGKMVVINLQPTKHDKKADLIINTFVDDVMEKLLAELGFDLPEYNPLSDPTRKVRKNRSSSGYLEWTQSAAKAKKFKALADKADDEFKLKKKLGKAKRAAKRKDDLDDNGGEKNIVVAENQECEYPPMKMLRSEKTDGESQMNGDAVKVDEVKSSIGATAPEIQSVTFPVTHGIVNGVKGGDANEVSKSAIKQECSEKSELEERPTC